MLSFVGILIIYLLILKYIKFYLAADFLNLFIIAFQIFIFNYILYIYCINSFYRHITTPLKIYFG